MIKREAEKMVEKKQKKLQKSFGRMKKTITFAAAKNKNEFTETAGKREGAKAEKSKRKGQ